MKALRKHQDEVVGPASDRQPAQARTVDSAGSDDRWVSELRNDLAAFSLSTGEESSPNPHSLGELWDDSERRSPRKHEKLC